MSEALLFNRLILIWMILGGAIFIGLFFISAPYGRFASSLWGPPIPARLSWVIMEILSPVLVFYFFITGELTTEPVILIFLLLWEIHYIQRTFIYPALMRSGSSPMPLAMLFFGIGFNSINAWFNGRWVFHLSTMYDTSWLTDLRFISGIVVFITGFIINLHSDAVLRKLRRPGESGYGIPRGGLYHWISNPNYLGEILEWGGWALATWSLAGLSFFVWTVANLVPRALASHRWYKRKFRDYPPERHALIPYIF